jgi:transposase
MQIREVKTGSDSIAVQVIYYKNRKRVVFKHVGSGKTVEQVTELRLIAEEIIKSHSNQLSIFEEANAGKVFYADHCECIGVVYNWLYKIITSIQKKIGFNLFASTLINDLVTIRIMEPASKLRSMELLHQYFGIKHRRQSFYESALNCLALKESIQQAVIEFAKESYRFTFELLFYDVTTLYFETFTDDALRKTGFSKDNKSQQPQIVVALMVSKEGFPIAYEIFSGDTFEGHTFLPVIKDFVYKHKVKNLTVVADAAMISDDNVKALLSEGLYYIVGARLGNISNELLEQLDNQLLREDEQTIRLKTDKGDLVCSYSQTRAKKDRYEMEKQIEKAEQLLKTPSKIKKIKFLKSEEQKLVVNKSLIEKTKTLLGVKGYYTNLPKHIADNKTIIERYHELYKIEQAFRIAKSDLETRPIFHFKEEPIKLHMLICFMALVVSKHIELQTMDSIRKFITEGKKVTDVKLLNNISNKELLVKGKSTIKANEYERQLGLSH